MRIIIDLDHSLIRTESLKARMFELVKAFGVSKAVWDRTYAATVKRNRRRYGYNTRVHGEKIARTLGKPELSAQITSRLYAAISKTPNLVYKDAVRFLTRASKAGIKIILLTRGDTAWQNRKIEVTRLRRFFDRVIITSKDKSTVLASRWRPKPHTYLLTDNAEEIQELRDLPVEIIQLVRSDGRYQRRAPGIPVVYNLNQAWKIIKEI